jgi:hypothetical protein
MTGILPPGVDPAMLAHMINMMNAELGGAPFYDEDRSEHGDDEPELPSWDPFREGNHRHLALLTQYVSDLFCSNVRPLFVGLYNPYLDGYSATVAEALGGLEMADTMFSHLDPESKQAKLISAFKYIKELKVR